MGKDIGSVKGLSLYEQQGAAIESVSPGSSIEKTVHNSWIQLTKSFFEVGGPLEKFQAVVDRRATTDGKGCYQVFCTVEDGDGKQTDVQISKFTEAQKLLLEKIFNWKVADPKPSTNTTAPAAGVPADFTEIKELLRQQAENLDELACTIYRVQDDSKENFNTLERTLAGQDKTHAQNMRDMKADYDKQLLDLLKNMKEQHENFVHSINIKLDGGNKEQEIARLKLTVELQEKMLNRVGDRVRFMDGSFERLWELLQRNNRAQNAMDPNLAKNIVEEQQRLLEEHRKLLEQMEQMKDVLGQFGAASENLQKKTDLMAKENLENQQQLQKTLQSMNEKMNSETNNNRDALNRVIQDLKTFAQGTTANQTTMQNALSKLAIQLQTIQEEIPNMQKAGTLHNKALLVLVEELEKLKQDVIKVNSETNNNAAVNEKIIQSIEEISKNQALLKLEIGAVAKSNRDALNLVVENLKNFVQTMTANQSTLVQNQLLLRNGLNELTRQLQAIQEVISKIQKEGAVHDTALFVLVEELEKLKKVVVTVGQNDNKDQLEIISQQLLAIQNLLRDGFDKLGNLPITMIQEDYFPDSKQPTKHNPNTNNTFNSAHAHV
jgi:DNA repair exonuclease SbcCD ATPase subunit